MAIITLPLRRGSWRKTETLDSTGVRDAGFARFYEIRSSNSTYIFAVGNVVGFGAMLEDSDGCTIEQFEGKSRADARAHYEKYRDRLTAKTAAK